MTVQELIAKLKKMPNQNSEVLIEQSNGYLSIVVDIAQFDGKDVILRNSATK